MSWLLDTNVLSELKRPNPSHRVVAFLAACPLEQLYVSTVTLAEIRFGIQLTVDPDRRVDLDRWLAMTVRPMFLDRVLEIEEDTMLRWRLLVEDGRKTGRTFPQPDLLVAALTLQHDLTLVTRNVKDFAGLNLKIQNPWDEN
jgi:predicted nucleic acid-binding protein